MKNLCLASFLMNQLIFNGMEFFNAALIIFSIIFLCLSYVLFKLYRANQQNKSISRLPDKEALKGTLRTTENINDQINKGK